MRLKIQILLLTIFSIATVTGQTVNWKAMPYDSTRFYGVVQTDGDLRVKGTQVIGGTFKSNSAALDIQSTTKGVLVPRVTTAQMLAIPSGSEKGLLVYNTDSVFFYYRDGSTWYALKAGTSSGGGTTTLQQAYDNGTGVINTHGGNFSIDSLGLFELKDKQGSPLFTLDAQGRLVSMGDYNEDYNGTKVLLNDVDKRITLNTYGGTVAINADTLLISGGSTGEVLTYGADGRATWQTGGTSYTFGNGLTETGGAVELGAPLTRSTTVSGIGYTFKQPSAYADFINGYDTIFGFSLPFVGFKKYKSPTLFTTIGMINVGTFGGDTADLYFGDLDYTGAKSTRLRVSSTTGSADLTALKNIVLSPDSALTINTRVLNENIAGRISTHADNSINIQSDKSVIISSEENGSIDAAASSSVTLTVHPWEAGLFNYWGATNPNSINANIYTGKTYPSLGGGILDWNSWFVGSDTTTGFSASGMYQLRTPATDSFDSNKHLIDIKSDSLKIVFNANSSNVGGLAIKFADDGVFIVTDTAQVLQVTPTGNIVMPTLGVYANDAAAAAGGVPLYGLYEDSVTGYLRRRKI